MMKRLLLFFSGKVRVRQNEVLAPDIFYKIFKRTFYQKWNAVAIVLALLLPIAMQAQLPPLKVNSFVSCPKPGYIKASRYLTSTAFTNNPGREIVDNNGNTYIIAEVSGGNYMGSSSTFPNILITKLAPDGSVIWNRLTAGTTTSAGEVDYSSGTAIEGNYLYVKTNGAFSDYSGIVKVPGIGSNTRGQVLLKINTSSGIIEKAYALAIHNDWMTNSRGIVKVKNGEIYYAVSTTTSPSNLVSTDGSSLPAGKMGVYVAKLNSSGTLVYGSFYSPPVGGSIQFDNIQIDDAGNCYLQIAAFPGGDIFTKLNATGQEIYKVSEGDEWFSKIMLNGGSLYYWYCSDNGKFEYVKRDATSGNEIFHKTWNLTEEYILGNAGSGDDMFKIVGNYTYGFYSDFDHLIMFKIDNNNGAMVWRSQAPINVNVNSSYPKLDVDESGNIWVTYATLTAGGVTTNGSAYQGGENDMAVVGFNNSGDIIASMYLGGSGDEKSNGKVYHTVAKGGKVYITYGTSSTDYPVTIAGSTNGSSNQNIVWTVLDFNADVSNITNTITPDNVSICKFGASQLLTGNKVDLNVDKNVPLLFRNGQAGAQSGLRYQWQSSTDNLSWADIEGATSQNYLPASAEVTTYYRRQIFYTYSGCTTSLSTSNTAKVTVGSNIAPSVNAPVSAYTTCPGTPVNLELDITNNNGGNPTYSVVWDNSTNTLSNITLSGTIAKAKATTNVSTVYTAKITDNTSGCVQFGQVQVMTYTAGANQTAMGKCGNDPVVIGNLPAAAGVPGVTYSWLPAAGLDCATCPQPKASAAGTYTLTMKVPVTGGGTCNSTMTSTVVAVAAPAIADFAGPDIALCSPANASVNISATIGSSSSPDWSYDYTWSPGSYIDNIESAFNPELKLGSLLPSPNPMTFYLTASKDGCSFVDSMKLSVLRADAGIDGCGPRMIGNTVDPTPGIENKTYKWEALDVGAGYATFQPTSSTTNQVAFVTKATIPTRFRLTVTDPATGAKCSSTVVVTDCGCVNSKIEVLGGLGCAKFTNGGPVVQMLASLPGYPDNGNLEYDWSPKEGLDRYNAALVTLTDGTNRTYTVTFKDKYSGTEICSVSREVNGPGWSYPEFNAPDIKVCRPSSGINTISIGRAPVSGFNYQWTGIGLVGSNTSNPSVDISSSYNSQSYTVTVTDAVNGCMTHDTVNITVEPTIANAGPDIIVCGSAITELAQGVDSLVGYQYKWEAVLPPGTPDDTQWENGTDNTWLHAKIIVGGDITYTLTATNIATGCIATDVVEVHTNKPSIININGSGSVCKGSSVTLTTPLYAGASYSWSSSDPTEPVQSGTGLNTVTVTPKKSVTYTLTIDFGGSCGISTATKEVTVTDLSYTPSDHGVYCPSTNPNTLTLGPTANPAGGVAPYTYSWSPAHMVASATSRNTYPSQAPTVTTNYMLTISDANGCSVTTTETVTVDAASKPKAGASRNMCMGTTETLGDASNTGVTWYAVAPASTSQLSSSTIGNPVFTPTAAGTYKFYVKYNSGGCVNPDTVVVVVRANPVISAGGATLCKGTNTSATIGTSPVAGLSYQWSPVTGIDNPTASQTVVHTTTGTVYTLTATDQYGCQGTVNVPVVVSATATPAITVPDLLLCFGSGSRQFEPQISPVAGNYSYQWSPAAGLSNSNVASPYLTPTDLGTVNHYTLTVTDQATGCFAQAPAVAKTEDCTTPLPVTFLYFNATEHNGKGVLNWATSTELNSSYYEVQRSNDGLSWMAIGQVKATNQSTGSRYGFVDNGLSQGTSYYRLKEVDMDGHYMYSAVKEVNMSNGHVAAKPVSWYPNPAAGQIKVKTNGETISVLTITDMSGRTVYQQTGVPEGTFTLPSSLRTGMYIISFRVGSNVQSDKLMLLR